MLNRRYRFHGYNALKHVYSRSSSVRGPLVSLRYSPRKPNQPHRVAVVVGRKVHKSAVKRNRIRRRIYEVIRESEYVPEATDLIFAVYSDQVVDLPTKELKTQINDLLKKVAKNTLDH